MYQIISAEKKQYFIDNLILLFLFQLEMSWRLKEMPLGKRKKEKERCEEEEEEGEEVGSVRVRSSGAEQDTTLEIYKELIFINRELLFFQRAL